MKFDDVLKDLAGHAIEDANTIFLVQLKLHDFQPFTVERDVITDGGSKFRIKIEFEPDPIEALQPAVARN